MTTSAKDDFLARLQLTLESETLVKLTLGAPCGTDVTLRNVFVRPVRLKTGDRLQFVYRHATRDVTKNFSKEETLTRIEALLGTDFGTAHLFTTEQTVEWDYRRSRVKVSKARQTAPPDTSHDRVKHRWVDVSAAWLRALDAKPDKVRQIQKYVEILSSLVAAAGLPTGRQLRLVDMGCGKGYLTFAAQVILDAEVRGIEARPELVELGNRVAHASGLTGLQFEAGTIANAPLAGVDVLVALHACDTATDDALAKGIQAGAKIVLVAPCCHKEVRQQLVAPPVLADALKHGILLERQAEFVTDALRAALLEWAGYETKVFEFIATEHTAKNLMIAAVKRPHSGNREKLAQRVRDLAGFYGVCTQKLATQLGFALPS